MPIASIIAVAHAPPSRRRRQTFASALSPQLWPGPCRALHLHCRRRLGPLGKEATAMKHASIFLAIPALMAGCAITPPAGDPLITTDHLVPHVSTVHANAGQKVGLFVRQK